MHKNQGSFRGHSRDSAHYMRWPVDCKVRQSEDKLSIAHDVDHDSCCLTSGSPELSITLPALYSIEEMDLL